MVASFNQYLVEEEKTIFFTFGRCNPPTIGHGKLMDAMAAAAGKNPYKVFLSQQQEPGKNPLSYSDKIKHVRKMFPKHARQVTANTKIKTVMDVLVSLHEQGFRHVVMVVGQDRVISFDALLSKYNGTEGRHGFYHFASIRVISGGKRDPDAEGVEGSSASKQRQAATDNDFPLFSQGVPATMNTSDTRKLFNDVRRGLGLAETESFKNHIQLAPVDEARELYVAGKLFSVGDQVVIKATEEVATITVLGANYVIIESNDGKRVRKWLNDVEPVVQPEWGTPESAKKARAITPGQPVKESKSLQIGIRQLQQRLRTKINK